MKNGSEIGLTSPCFDFPAKVKVGRKRAHRVECTTNLRDEMDNYYDNNTCHLNKKGGKYINILFSLFIA